MLGKLGIRGWFCCLFIGCNASGFSACRELEYEAASNSESGSESESSNDTDGDPACEELAPHFCAEPKGSIALNDSYNFFLELDMQIADPTPVKGTSTFQDLVFDWGGLTQGLMGDPVNPKTDIDLVIVSLWDMSIDELEQAINTDSLGMADGGAVSLNTDRTITSANLLSFHECGSDVSMTNPTLMDQVTGAFNGEDPQYDRNEYTHLMLVKSGDSLNGSNAKMVKAFYLDPTSTNTTVTIDNGSSVLSSKADLRSMKWISMARNNPSLTIDWNDLMLNGIGNEFVSFMVSRIVVAHLPLSVCQIEEQVLNLEASADARYSKTLDEASTSFDLSQLTDVHHTPFPGIDSDNGTWILALFPPLSEMNPAPLFMTVLQPC